MNYCSESPIKEGDIITCKDYSESKYRYILVTYISPRGWGDVDAYYEGINIEDGSITRVYASGYSILRNTGMHYDIGRILKRIKEEFRE